MPRTLDPVQAEQAIVDSKGRILIFFRLLWQNLIDLVARVNTRALLSALTQTAAIATANLYTTTDGALFRVSWYLRKTVADGAASSLTLTIGWVDGGVALTASGAALTIDTASAQQSGSMLVRADPNSSITYAVAYTSTTPNRMTYDAVVTAEELT